jgi:hypothetical protein
MSTKPRKAKKKSEKRGAIFAPADQLWSQPDVILKDNEVIPPNFKDDAVVAAGQGVNYNGYSSLFGFNPVYGSGDGDRQGDDTELRAVDLSLTFTSDSGIPTTWRLILALFNENNTLATSSGLLGDLFEGYVGSFSAPNSPLGFKAVRSKKYTILVDERFDIPVLGGTYGVKTISRKIDLRGRKVLCRFIAGVTTGTGMPVWAVINDSNDIVAAAPTVTGLVRYHYVSV